MELFLFPLVNVVLYPSTSRPITVFDPRYVQMMKNAAETKTPVAIGYVDDVESDGKFKVGDEVSFVRDVAGFGDVLILEERLDGSLLVFIQGRGKARLGEALERGTPYIVVKAEEIRENNQVDDEHKHKLEVLHRVLGQWVYTHMPDAQQRHQFMMSINLPDEILGCFASYLIQDFDLQQMILESSDINEKIEMIHRLVQSGEIV